MEPRWTHADKEGIGTAYSVGSHIWFTVRSGILNEVYYPTVDRPQLRDLGFLFCDGQGLFLEEKHDLEHQTERMSPTQGYRVSCRDREGRFAYTKEIISEPERPCVLIHTEFSGDESFLDRLQTYVLCAPHLSNGGKQNNAFIVEVSGRELLAAERENRWLIVGASSGFSKLSCGYVGQNDGYTDLARNRKMTFEFDEAKDGNVALTGQLDLGKTRHFTVGLAFGQTLSSAVSCLFQGLGVSYKEQRKMFFQQWERASHSRKPLASASGDHGLLYESSYNLLLTHEDKLYQGAFVASLTIPWGEARNDEEGKGGYHLVWTRDMVESALGLLAAGNKEAPFRALVYLAARQEEAGNFPQNFWVDGQAFWTGMQLDEVAFPVLLAWRLQQAGLLHQFEPGVMVHRAVGFLLHSGPITGEERWEEASGYSPSTLAVIISAFICAAAFARTEHNEAKATFLDSYADYLRAHMEEWTVTTEGSLLADVPRYFVRLNPAKPGQAAAPGSVNTADLHLTSQPPGSPDSFPARNVVDGGFLQLVRYGVLAAGDSLIVDSLKVIDATIQVETPAGKCWHRYNHDGYGQKPDGGAYEKWGRGRPWPLLTGERAHYELAAGKNPSSLLHTMEKLCNQTQLLPEQIWDGEAIAGTSLRRGGPSGSANPLLWAHSEYVRLLRSCHDGKVFDVIPEVVEHCQKGSSPHQSESNRFEFWLPKHPIQQARKGHTLRICAREAFRLRWTSDGWKTWHDSESQPTHVTGDYVDLKASEWDSGVEFTFFWQGSQQWEGQNYSIAAY